MHIGNMNDTLAICSAIIGIIVCCLVGIAHVFIGDLDRQRFNLSNRTAARRIRYRALLVKILTQYCNENGIIIKYDDTITKRLSKETEQDYYAVGDEPANVYDELSYSNLLTCGWNTVSSGWRRTSLKGIIILPNAALPDDLHYYLLAREIGKIEQGYKMSKTKSAMAIAKDIIESRLSAKQKLIFREELKNLFEDCH